MSDTYYFGGKGDEIANYSYNYKLGTTTISSTSKFFYGTGFLAADNPLTTTTDAIDQELKAIRARALVAANLMSDTYYFGGKGDEIANYSYNYKLGQQRYPQPASSSTAPASWRRTTR